ncbi:MAG: SPASM domain-containing protein [Candidatus Omnitrophica bacterium]|nr:SPASM domain-containing protein [Candidatus Omnitrophota bacterium]
MSKPTWKQVTVTGDPDAKLAQILGEPYRAYRQRWEEAKELKVVQDYPIHIDFELYYGCNLRCPQCVLQIKPEEFDANHPYAVQNRQNVVTFEKFKEIIDEGVPHGLASVTLNVNNEPLGTRNLHDYIRYASQAGVLDVIILTNATMLTETRAQELLNAGLTKLYFSLDAIREDTYNHVRPGGNFQQVMGNINRFLEMKKAQGKQLPITRVSFVKSKLNHKELDEFVAYWKDRVDFICIQSFVNPAASYSNYAQLEQQFRIPDTDLLQVGDCPQPYQRVSINNDGSVHPCCSFDGLSLHIGNVFDQRLHAIWNSEEMKRLRLAVNDPDGSKQPLACQRCRKAVFPAVFGNEGQVGAGSCA